MPSTLTYIHENGLLLDGSAFTLGWSPFRDTGAVEGSVPWALGAGVAGPCGAAGTISTLFDVILLTS